MIMTKVEKLAAKFGRGEATAADVVAAARARAALAPGYTPAETYDEMARRVETDESVPFDTDGWDGVTCVYVADGLTYEQYAQSHALYVIGLALARSENQRPTEPAQVSQRMGPERPASSEGDGPSEFED